MYVKPFIGAFFVLCSFLWVSYGHAISLTTIEGTYSQNFDSLAKTGNNNSLSLDGWAMSTSTYRADSGTITVNGMRSYGASPTAIDRAFGSLSVSTDLFYGAMFTNETGFSINSLFIEYYGEQWRRGNNANPDTLYFQYSLDAESLTSTTATWIDVTDLNFVSPIVSATSAAALNGNNVLNKKAIEFEIESLEIENGATFWIRFKDVNISGDDDGLALDDFQLTPYTIPVPEPTTSILMGMGLLGVFFLRRARRKA